MFGDLVVNLVARVNQFTGPMNRARGSLRGIQQEANHTVNTATRLTGLVSTIAKVAVAYGAISIATSGMRWGIETAAQAEQSQIAFTTMLGDADRARSMLSELISYSSATPYSQQGIINSAQTLLNFGVAANRILPIVQMLGDVAAGNEQRFGSLALVFGQISSTGRLTGQDLLQLINAGFNPLQEIAKQTGESMAELKKRMEAGGISADEVTAAFERATSAGGRFHRMAEAQSKTLTGLWSTFKDEVGLTLGGIATLFIEKLNIKGWLQTLIDQVHEFRTGVLGDADVDGVTLGMKPEEWAKSEAAFRAQQSRTVFAGGQFREVSAESFAQDVSTLSNQLGELAESLKNTKQEFDRAPKLRKGNGGIIFFEDSSNDPNDPNYVSGAAAADAAQQQKDWEDRWKREAESRSLKLSAALVIGSREAYSSIVQAMTNARGPSLAERQFALQQRQEMHARKAADNLEKLNRKLDQNQLVVVENLDD